MKVQKMITIDIELAKQLNHEPNASAVVNDLLKEHYNKRLFPKLTPMEELELTKKLKALELKAQEIYPDATIRIR